MLHPIPLRHLRISPPIVLAPLEGLTDLPFRRLVRRIGGTGLTVTEFIPSEGLVRHATRVEEMAAFDPDEVPVSVQIYGRRPPSMADAARIVADMGAHVVDINMGCPARKVCAHSGGASLMRDPALARDIVRAVRAATDLPLTVKMRAGYSDQERNAAEIAWMCQEEGADGVTVHWRTRQDGFGGTLRLDPIAQVKARLSIPVVGNGDVVDLASAERMLRETGCDGLMVGRGAVRNPWLPLQLHQGLEGQPVTLPGPTDRRDFLLEYVALERARFRTPMGALGRLKKLAGYITWGIPGGSTLRQSLFHSHTLEEALDHIQGFFDPSNAI